MPVPMVQPTRFVDCVSARPTFAAVHQPTGNAVPQKTVASRCVKATPPVTYSNVAGVQRYPARARMLPSQDCLTLVESAPGDPTTAGFSAPGIPAMVLLLSAQAMSPSIPTTHRGA